MKLCSLPLVVSLSVFAGAYAVPARALEVVAGSPYSQQADYSALKSMIESLRANVIALTDDINQMKTCSTQRKIWDGTACQSVGETSGLIAAFATTACPSGWSEYTLARGRFLRGIDNGAGNDPDGTRAPGSVQLDALRSHTHTFSGRTNTDGAHQHSISGWAGGYNQYHSVVSGDSWNSPTTFYTNVDGAHYHYFSGTTDATGLAETRPKNVAVLYCKKD